VLGYGDNGERREIHNLARVVGLAATPLDALRSFGGWAWPLEIRNKPSAALDLFVERVRKPLRSTIARTLASAAERGWGNARGAGRGPAPSLELNEPRPLRVGRESLVTLAHDAREHGGVLWVRIHGTSMLPAIPRGSLVRLAPLPARPLRVGDVVLFHRALGAPRLHRIVGVGDGALRTQGDNCYGADRPIPLDRVLMLADLVEIDGRTRPIAPAPRRVLRRLASRIRGLRQMRA
jgi:hypothetical protein